MTTSMDDVAREAAVSKATLYAHFANKETLFAEAARAGRARVASLLFVTKTITTSRQYLAGSVADWFGLPRVRRS